MSLPYHKQQVTPLAVDIAVHYATCCNDYVRMWPPAVVEVIRQFQLQGLLRKTTEEEQAAGWFGQYKGTEKCRAWVELMCKTPFPVEVWVDPRTEEPV